MALLSKDLGLDLGTLFIRVSEGGEILLEEPTVAAIVIDEQNHLTSAANCGESCSAWTRALPLSRVSMYSASGSES